MRRLPPARFVALATLVLVCAAAESLHRHGFPPTWRSLKALAFIALPYVPAAWASAAAQRLLRPGWPASSRLLFVLAGTLVLGIGLASGIFVLQHVASYPQPFPFTFSESGLYVLGWSVATSLYFYTASLPLHLPWMPLAILAVAGLWAAESRR